MHCGGDITPKLWLTAMFLSVCVHLDFNGSNTTVNRLYSNIIRLRQSAQIQNPYLFYCVTNGKLRCVTERCQMQTYTVAPVSGIVVLIIDRLSLHKSMDDFAFEMEGKSILSVT